SGYDSAYFGESAFLTLGPGQSGQFAVGFNNTGSTGWLTGSASQVDLAICLPDKTTCNTTSPNAAFASSWLSSTAYATTSTTFVGYLDAFLHGRHAVRRERQHGHCHDQQRLRERDADTNGHVDGGDRSDLGRRPDVPDAHRLPGHDHVDRRRRTGRYRRYTYPEWPARRHVDDHGRHG